MISVIINFIKEKSKIIYSVLSIILIIYFMISNLGEFKNILIKLKPIIIITLNVIPSILVVLIFIIGTRHLLKTSNIKSNKRMDEYLKSQRIELKTKGCKEISVMVTQEYDYINGEERQYIKVKVINEHGNTINLVDGFVFFYYKKERVKVIPIKVNQLNEGYSERVYYKEVDENTVMWDQFDVFINSMIIDKKEHMNLILKSPNIYKTYYFILNFNRFSDHRIFGIKVKYNLVWLKEKILESRSAIRFFYSKKTYKVYTYRYYYYVKEILGLMLRLLKRLLVYAILSSIILIIIVAFIDVFFLVKEILFIIIKSY
ncbi:hypothetical protein H7E67_16815 [Clostridium gasigenes]|uniref:hypothetical protein n=1 Tax=Clostridium gasigenes TaxID=94869 RepID=UPI001627A842|nr:hypothetical protein [Clostridium gasigenes]MBB6625084.1 hypothetical protein [Clostridium gasigenes]